MFCNGNCGVCVNQCFRGEKVYQMTEEENKKASEVFDSAIVSKNVATLQIEDETTKETGLSVVENVGTYEIKKSVFGKEKVRKIK